MEEHHTLEDLKALSSQLEKLTGYSTTQLAIHRDEGKDTANINYHGHLVFFTLDENGKSLQRQNFNNKEKMRQAQTITANILNMARGTSKEITQAEHLNHKQYKASLAIAEKHKMEEMHKWHNKLKEQFINILETTARAVKKFFMSEQINQMEAENIQLKQQVIEHKNQINQQHDKIKFITEEAEHYQQRLIREISKHIPNFEQRQKPRHEIYIEQAQHKTKSQSRSI